MPKLLATGKPIVHTRVCQVLIITDEAARLIAVGVVGKDNQRISVAMAGEEPTMILRARWNQSMPMPGDYVRSAIRPRTAYRIVGARVTGRTDDHEHLELRVTRAGLPLPVGAVVHPWRWHPTDANAGKKTPLDTSLRATLCDTQRATLAALVSHGGWARPRDLGGSDGSHHSMRLLGLVDKGLAERQERGGRVRRSYLYRATDLGRSFRG